LEYLANFKLTISDIKVGFDQLAVQIDKKGSSFGLIGMRQRTEIINGTITIDTAEDHGTVVQLTVPTT